MSLQAGDNQAALSITEGLASAVYTQLAFSWVHHAWNAICRGLRESIPVGTWHCHVRTTGDRNIPRPAPVETWQKLSRKTPMTMRDTTIATFRGDAINRVSTGNNPVVEQPNRCNGGLNVVTGAAKMTNHR